ncbi:hypothetical protein [Aquisalimonas sp.]|uniref:hypothetical protein n=1 Tax=Aquisalimonas sp. TaxID=1872621 RepID=UPI0025BFBD83|nr:hypothetical protein [Aquisalimonas sp.]
MAPFLKEIIGTIILFVATNPLATVIALSVIVISVATAVAAARRRATLVTSETAP